jgi:hypothetical protein
MKIITLNLEEKDDMTTTMTMILHLFGEQAKTLNQFRGANLRSKKIGFSDQSA